MLRRLVVLATLMCGVVLLSAFGLQNGIVGINIDVAGILTRLAYGAASLVGAALLWLGKKALDTINRVECRVEAASVQLSTISHELFGVSGNNGLRSELKSTAVMVQRHNELLGILADRAHVKHMMEDK